MKKLVILFLIVLFSCGQNNKIEPGDIVQKCVIVSKKNKLPQSTIEFDVKWVYTTDCGFSLFTLDEKSYEIGDTIIYEIKKKVKE